MINISTACLLALKKDATQLARITVQPLTGDTFTIRESDITLGGLKIETHSVDGDVIQIGNFNSAILSLTLDNDNEKYSGIFFAGARLLVEIGITLADSTIEWIKKGAYTVDEQPRALSTIQLEAYDNAVRLDVTAVLAESLFPCSLRSLVMHALDAVGLIYDAANIAARFSAGITVQSVPISSSTMTWRQIIMWCCQCSACCGYADENGYIKFKWYNTTSDISIAESDRYQGSQLDEQVTTLTGHQFVIDDTSYPSSADSTYLLQTKENAIFETLNDTDKTTVAAAVNTAIDGFSYWGYSCAILSYPHLQALDRITFVRDGVEYSTVITNYNFVLNGNMSIAAKAQSQQAKGYASLGGLTAAQKAVIDRLNRKVDTTAAELTNRENTLLAFSEALNCALGLYKTKITSPDGSVTEYAHNKSTLADSSLIYLFNAAGFAWTNDWNNGAPVWKYGVDSEGNAILSSLYAYKIQADYLEVGATTASYNTAQNSSFERDDTAHWNLLFGVDNILNGEFSASGIIAAEIISSGGFDGRKYYTAHDVNIDSTFPNIYYGAAYTEQINCAGNQKFVVSAYVKLSAIVYSSQRYAIRIKYHHAETENTAEGYTYSWNYFTPSVANKWERLYSKITTPADCDYFEVQILANLFESSDFSVDGLLVQATEVLQGWAPYPYEQINSYTIIDDSGIRVIDGKISIYDGNNNAVLQLTEAGTMRFTGLLANINYPVYSARVGPAEQGSGGAFTVTDSTDGYGDLIQIYKVATSGTNEKGVVWTPPFLTNSSRTNRKGIHFLKNIINIFADGTLPYTENGDDYPEINLSTGLARFRVFKDTFQFESRGVHPQTIPFNFYGGAANFRFCDGSGTGALGNIAANFELNEGYIYHLDRIIMNWDTTTYPSAPGISIGDSDFPLYLWGSTILANGITVTSERSKKSKISNFEDSVLDKVKAFSFYSYDLKIAENKKTKMKIPLGIMADEAPSEILGADGKSIDLYQYCNLLAKSVQELNTKVEKLEAEIIKIKEAK